MSLSAWGKYKRHLDKRTGLGVKSEVARDLEPPVYRWSLKPAMSSLPGVGPGN